MGALILSKNYILPPMLAGEVAKRSFDGGVVNPASCKFALTQPPLCKIEGCKIAPPKPPLCKGRCRGTRRRGCETEVL